MASRVGMNRSDCHLSLSLLNLKTALGDAFTLSRRGTHVELGAREKAVSIFITGFLSMVFRAFLPRRTNGKTESELSGESYFRVAFSLSENLKNRIVMFSARKELVKMGQRNRRKVGCLNLTVEESNTSDEPCYINETSTNYYKSSRRTKYKHLIYYNNRMMELDNNS
ncbi:hypothetical protein M9H77_19402 [Catharanthus roseus]|uniref:Uncharacterized protein n=1 Tax=Catharanthus roseus TaxID=4058 RepID=A0ACC0BA99_CATRO|nr:hypothetical protein M9H77_19402 [Catharanthus roseus]